MSCKGIVSRDEYFFKGPICQISFFYIRADSFEIVQCFVILLASMNLPSYYENPFRNLLQRPSSVFFDHAWKGIQEAACDSEKSSKAIIKHKC
jgi:hypothetical protein